MFTGIVQGRGEVVSVERRGEELRLRLRPLFDWEAPRIGESVAVNGACLTMETWNAAGPSLTAYASAETVARTSLGELRVGAHVNMERALAVGDRLGGHLVSGHVDAVARVESVSPAGSSRRIRLVFDECWSAQIIPKGSVALDGVSLTVNECGPGFLEVNVIPETWRATTVGEWSPGRRINLETDVIGKYVSHLLKAFPALSAAEKGDGASGAATGMTWEFLGENGFL